MDNKHIKSLLDLGKDLTEQFFIKKSEKVNMENLYDSMFEKGNTNPISRIEDIVLDILGIPTDNTLNYDFTKDAENLDGMYCRDWAGDIITKYLYSEITFEECIDQITNSEDAEAA